MHPVFRVIACSDLDLWSQKLISMSINPNTSVTKTGWNSFHWFVRYGVHKVFGSLRVFFVNDDENDDENDENILNYRRRD